MIGRILFDDAVRPFMIEFMAKRVNTQLNRLKRLNANAFMYVDEPGLQFLFSAMAGYGDQAGKHDMEVFFSMIGFAVFIFVGTRTGIFC